MNKSEKIIELIEKSKGDTMAVHIHPNGESVADGYLKKNGIKHTKKKRHTAIGPQFIYRFRSEFYPGFVTNCAPHVSTTGSAPTLDAGSALPAGTGAGDGP